MQRIRKKETKETVRYFDSKTNVIKAAIITAVVVVAIIVLMLLETDKKEIKVMNDSDLKLEYVKTYFVNVEGPMNEGTSWENIAAGSSASVLTGEQSLLNQNANLEILFKFENHDELFVDAGIFNENFSGDIDITFDQKNDNEIQLNVKAKSGLFTSQLVNCDEEYMINLSEGYVAE